MITLLALCATASSASADTVTWNGSSGLLPTQITPPYTLVDNAVANPVLSGGILTLNTSSEPLTYMLYDQSGLQLAVPSNLVIEANMRFVSGTSPGTTRAPAGIQFVPAPGLLNFLWIQSDLIFLNQTGDVRGPSAVVDTDGAFHTYRIEVTGQSLGSAVNVFYDNGAIPVLTGALFATASTTTFIDWGDLTDSPGTGGISEWQSFQHNAGVPEPNSAILLLFTGGCLLARRIRARNAH